LGVLFAQFFAINVIQVDALAVYQISFWRIRLALVNVLMVSIMLHNNVNHVMQVVRLASEVKIKSVLAVKLAIIYKKIYLVQLVVRISNTFIITKFVKTVTQPAKNVIVPIHHSV